MTTAEINADMLAFWKGKGGHTWVARQESTGRDVVDQQRVRLNEHC